MKNKEELKGFLCAKIIDAGLDISPNIIWSWLTSFEELHSPTLPNADTTIPHNIGVSRTKIRFQTKKATSKCCQDCNMLMTEEEFKIQAGYCNECICKRVIGNTS